MNRPLVALDKNDSATPAVVRKKADVVSIVPDALNRKENLLASSSIFVLADFKTGIKRRDSKLVDFLLIGILSIGVHTTIVEYFNRVPIAKEEPIEPVKIPPKVQISFVKPKIKPVVQPPPPPPKVVALNKPPKPKIKPKQIPKIVEPPPVQTQTTVEAPPTPAPQPPVQEKVTQPSAGAGYLNNPPPVYPEVAMDRGWEGRVLMKVHVRSNGKPDSVAVLKTSGREVLDTEAVRTVKKWSFVPAKRGSTPIDGWVTVPISFKLQG
jgi:periplasmic protein TonB